MKNLLIFFCLVSIPNLYSQYSVNSSDKKPSSAASPAVTTKKLSSAATVQNLVATMKHDTCLDKKFSLVFYFIQDSSSSITTTSIPTLNANVVNPKLNFLNNLFKRICVSFEHCKTVIIPNHIYTKWTYDIVDPAVTSVWYTENTINVYVPGKIDTSPCLSDYSYKPDSPSVNSPKNVIVTTGAFGNGSALAHAIGHFFGLSHTFDEINAIPPALPAPPTPVITSHEFVDRSNCSTHGDGICDTEADPYPYAGPTATNSHYHYFCKFHGNAKDGKGDFYTPPFDNYMSYYVDCRCRFTQEQYNRMAYIILTKRMYLH